MIRLSVIRGPDQGKEAAFNGARVAVGRGPSNAFDLRDGLVSQRHGEIVVSGGRVTYRDLRSRHGTLVRLNGVSVNLHDRSQVQEIELAPTTQIDIGETSIRVSLDQDPTLVDTPSPLSVADLSIEERVVKRSTESLDVVTRRLIHQDQRLVNIFKLSRSLNSASELHEILEQVCDASFDAFPSAKVFAILPMPKDDDAELETLILRERGERDTIGVAPVLSRSLMQQVIESKQSVLFVRDALGFQPTESIINASITACLAAPLVGQRELLGVMQIDTRGQGGLFGPDDLDLFTVVASYAAFAMERVQLSQAIQDQFEGIVKLSVAAIDARDPSTAGHSERVAEYTRRLAERAHQEPTGAVGQIRFSREEMRELRYAALLHDFGKIGVRERVLMKPARLRPEDLRNVVARFESARAAAARDAFAAAIQMGKEEELPIAEVERRALALTEARIRVLNTAERIVRKWQPGRPLSDGTAEELRRISRMTYTRSDGTREALLTPSELENMVIPRGTLNSQEWEDMRSHVSKSREFLCQIPWTSDLAQIPDIAGWHHEKLDGSGYPDGLKGEEIPPQVRILTIADIFDAMTAADRPYRSAASFERAGQVLTHEANSGLLDKDLVDLFCMQVLPQLPRRKS